MKNDETFIQFIDPEDIIEFIPDDALLENVGDEATSEAPFRVADSIIEEAESYSIKKKEDTRERLAIIYTVATLGIFVFVIILSFIESLVNKSDLVANLKEIIPLISGVLFGTLGFVLGYYFRNDSNERNSEKIRDNNRQD